MIENDVICPKCMPILSKNDSYYKANLEMRKNMALSLNLLEFYMCSNCGCTMYMSYTGLKYVSIDPDILLNYYHRDLDRKKNWRRLKDVTES